MICNNVLYISRPTKDVVSKSCNTSCNSLGVTDPLNVNLLSSRDNRKRVKEQIADQVLLMLGAPRTSIELDQQQLNGAIDMALQVLEDYCPREYFQWYTFVTTPGQSVYTLPPDIGMVREVNYKQVPQQAFSSSELGGVIPLEYMGGGAYGSIGGGINPQQPVWGKMGEWVLYKQYESLYNRLSSQEGGWEWIGGLNNIKLYPTPYNTQNVSVHYLQKNPDFRQVTEAMREGALAYAKIMLAEIRTKILNPPGGIQLNGQLMIERAYKEKEDWENRLITRFGDLLPITYG